MKLILLIVISASLFISGCASNKIMSSEFPPIIKQKMVDNVPAMRKCYKDELKKSKKNFTYAPYLNFEINKDGKTEKIKITTRKNKKNKHIKQINACIHKIVLAMVFPEPVEEKNIEVKQPFNFYTKKNKKKKKTRRK